MAYSKHQLDRFLQLNQDKVGNRADEIRVRAETAINQTAHPEDKVVYAHALEDVIGDPSLVKEFGQLLESGALM